MECFTCRVCGAAPELAAEGRAQLSVVRHASGCAVLCSQVRTRWPLRPPGLPDTGPPKAFANQNGYGPRRKRAPAKA